MDLDRLKRLAEGKLAEEIGSHFADKAVSALSSIDTTLGSIEDEMDKRTDPIPQLDKALADAKKAVTLAKTRTGTLQSLAHRFRL